MALELGLYIALSFLTLIIIIISIFLANSGHIECLPLLVLAATLSFVLAINSWDVYELGFIPSQINATTSGNTTTYDYTWNKQEQHIYDIYYLGYFWWGVSLISIVFLVFYGFIKSWEPVAALRKSYPTH